MKKLIIPLLLLFCSCAKKSVKPTNYLYGTWTNTITLDTVYSDSGKVYTTEPQQPDLYFTSNGVECDNSVYTYTDIIDFGNGRVFSITKINDTSIRLDWKYGNSWTVEYYIK